MRISDWSSDVCSSDLKVEAVPPSPAQRGDSDQSEPGPHERRCPPARDDREGQGPEHLDGYRDPQRQALKGEVQKSVNDQQNRKSCASGMGGSERVDQGRRRHITKKTHSKTKKY